MMKKSDPYCSQSTKGVTANNTSFKPGLFGDKKGIIKLEKNIAGPEDKAIKSDNNVNFMNLFRLVYFIMNFSLFFHNVCIAREICLYNFYSKVCPDHKNASRQCY